LKYLTFTAQQSSLPKGFMRHGNLAMNGNSDRHQTAGKKPRIRTNGDIDVDRIAGPAEAGLGVALDHAVEARLGIIDEEIEADMRDRNH